MKCLIVATCLSEHKYYYFYQASAHWALIVEFFSLINSPGLVNNSILYNFNYLHLEIYLTVLKQVSKKYIRVLDKEFINMDKIAHAFYYNYKIMLWKPLKLYVDENVLLPNLFFVVTVNLK